MILSSDQTSVRVLVLTRSHTGFPTCVDASTTTLLPLVQKTSNLKEFVRTTKLLSAFVRILRRECGGACGHSR
jgi:hypothetical protein